MDDKYLDAILIYSRYVRECGNVPVNSMEYVASKKLEELGYLSLTEVAGSLWTRNITPKGVLFIEKGGFTGMMKKERERRARELFWRIIIPVIAAMIGSISTYLLMKIDHGNNNPDKESYYNGFDPGNTNFSVNQSSVIWDDEIVALVRTEIGYKPFSYL